jgi:AAHS family 4-hydroxybenzoate transporter-like MFS transporter
MPTKIDINHVINNSKVSVFQLRVVALCIWISMLDGFNTQSIAFVAPALQEALSIESSSFGVVFSSALLGSGIGALSFGVLADKYGRKKLLILAVAIFSVMTLLCAKADSMTTLIIYRFLAGIGLGGALPNLITISSEYSPERLRSTFVVITIWGFPFGAIVGGIFSGNAIELYGWEIIFIAGGILPILTIPLLLLGMPESIRFLPYLKNSGEKISNILKKIAPEKTFNASDEYCISDPKKSGGNIRALFSKELCVMSILFSITYFMSLLLTFLLINWIPSLLNQAGLTIEDAVMGTVILNFAGIIGSFIFSRLIDSKGKPIFILAFGYFLGAIAVGLIGQVEISYWPLMICIFATGFFLLGPQMSLPGAITELYPTNIRSTGIGWIQFMGRAGSLLGPIIGGLLLSLGIGPSNLFNIGIIPAFVAAVSLFALTKIQAGKIEN